MNKKILILNGSHSEIPLINAAKNLDYKVITAGNDPSLPGHKYADEYCNEDFSDKEAVLSLAVDLGIDAICSPANDFGALTAAYVAEALNLPGHDTYETALTLHHKDRFKIFTEKHDFPSPRAKSFSGSDKAIRFVEDLELPLIVKPVDLTGGKGVSVIHENKQALQAVRSALSMSRVGRIVVEEYFDGTLHSFSSFIVNGEVTFYFSDNEYSYINPYLVTTSAAPATNIDRFATRLIQSVEYISKVLGLVDGVVHIQYLADGDSFSIIEITRRCSGDLYPYPVSMACAVDWGEVIVKAEAGWEATNLTESRQRGFVGRHCLMSEGNGVIKDIFISDKIRSYIVDKYLWRNKGDLIGDFMSTKIGVLVLSYPSIDEMEDITANISSHVRIDVR
ncbi:MAG: phosphoribosylglycinamide synthetase [Gammaproteobacteria bacterium]|nr:MAG: phosphoribosylglycinamide synthetase [Gammaproteobacteria bacterium]